MTNEIQAYVTGDGVKPYSIRFAEHLLEAKIKKYQDKGATLRLGQAHPMQPAAPAILTPKLWQNEGLSRAMGRRKGSKKSDRLPRGLLRHPRRKSPQKRPNHGGSKQRK